jgi:PAS domain S-box-containing protein
MSQVRSTYKILEDRIKILEKALADSQSKKRVDALASILEHAPISVIVFDHSWRILYKNKKTLEMLGYNENDISTNSIIIDESLKKYTRQIEKIKEKDIASFEVTHVKKNGSRISLEIFSSKIDWNGKPAYISMANDISERKKVEKALLLSEEKFQKAFKQSTSLMAVSRLKDGIYIDVNDSFVNNLGYTREEAIGKTSKILDLFIDPGIREKIISEFIKSGGSSETEVEVRSKTGKILTGVFSVDIITLNDEKFLLSQMNDITERKKASIELKASEARFKNIINASPMGMHLYELRDKEQLIFMEANPAADKILGINHTQFIGKTIEEAFPGLITTEVPEKYKDVALNGRTWQAEQVDYNEGFISGAFEVYAFQTDPGKMAVMFTEITERKRAGEELLKAKEKAEESDRLKTSFLQNMSHEIRTPMNAITGFASLLDNSELAADKRKNFTSIIVHSSNQLLSIVNDILTISSIDTRQEKVNIDIVNVNQVINDLQDIFKHRALIKNVEITSVCQLKDQEAEIYTDSTKLTQILTNLLSNALKFTQEGTINIGYKLQNEILEFFVKDNGIGIKAEVQDKIFERFRQADMFINKKYGGTGLGLAISKAFIELLGGKIWVESRIGKGSTFFFTIPYKPITSTKKIKIRNKNYSKAITVIIADDEELNLFYLEELLHDLNLRLLRANDGRETVDICKKDPTVRLILMDIRMPVLDGSKAAMEIKKIRPGLPIIAQSAYALDREIREYNKFGFDDYITKPIVKDELIEKVMKFIT